MSFDTPTSTDIGKFGGLVTADGQDKAWGNTFRILAQAGLAIPAANEEMPVGIDREFALTAKDVQPYYDVYVNTIGV